jgi:endonuclease-3 related protein
MTLALDGEKLRAIHDTMLECYGPQHWWPAKTPFEVMIGAVLTQNTAWTNVERAIANLRDADCLTLERILACPQQQLAQLIRPSGYFNIKADRLLHLCRFVADAGGVEALARLDDQTLRQAVLEVKGVGPETADDILLYAFHRPCFVIDAYTRRILSRVGLIGGKEPYESLRQVIEEALGRDVALYNEYHGLIVRHAKEACAKKPECTGCCLAGLCPWSRRAGLLETSAI